MRDVYPDPRAWVAMQGNDRLVSLAASDPDWCTVSSLLTRNLKCTVLQVERCVPMSVGWLVGALTVARRVQNRSLWQRFTHHSSLMLHRCDDGVNERWLWHGTSATPPSTLTTGFEGIDLRLVCGCTPSSSATTCSPTGGLLAGWGRLVRTGYLLCGERCLQ